jgi:hypothetical protein
MSDTYLVLKNGVYGHGVFHVGNDKDAAISAAIAFAEGDTDDHHSWDVVVFETPTDPTLDAVHENIFTTFGKPKRR